MSDDLDSGLAGQQWVVEAYLLTLVSLLLVGGSLGDQFGRRRIFVIGLAGFGVTSALCALAPSTGEFLIGARALQGIAGALLVPGLARDRRRHLRGRGARAGGRHWTAWTGIATVLGPAGGGALIEASLLARVFWVNLPLIVGHRRSDPALGDESRDPDAVAGSTGRASRLSAVGLGGPVFALIEQPTHGWGDPLVWVPLVAGLACFGLFLVCEARACAPDAEPDACSASGTSRSPT